MTARAFLGAGDLYIARFVNGVKGPLAGPFYSNKFEVKPDADTKNAISKGRSTRGQIIESVATQKPAGFSVEFSEVNKDSMTLALMGTLTTVTQASGSLSNEAVTLTHDNWIQLSKQNIGATGFVVTATPGGATFVEGTDYEVNRPLGMLRSLSTGTIPATQNVEVDATYAGFTESLIRGATNADIRAYFLFDGINAVDQSPTIVEVDEAIVSAGSAFDFLDDNFNTVPLTGTMKTQAGKTDPFRVRLRTVA